MDRFDSLRYFIATFCGFYGLVLLLAHPWFFSRMVVFQFGLTVCGILMVFILLRLGAFDYPRVFVRLLVPLFCTIAISILVNGLGSAISFWMLFSQCLFLYMGWWVSKNNKAIEITMVFLVIGIIIVCGYSFLQKSGLDPLPWGTLYEGRRIVSTFENPNYLSSVAACTMPILYACFLLTKNSFVRIIVGLAFAVDYGAWVMAGSRGGWLAGYIGMLILLFGVFRYWRCGRIRFPVKSNILLFFVLIGVTVFAMSSPVIANAQGELSVYERFLSLRHFFFPHGFDWLGFGFGPTSSVVGDVYVYDTTINHRYFIWQVALKMVEENPVIGIGFGRFAEDFGSYRDLLSDGDWFATLITAQQQDETKYAHNVYLQFSAECGILGLFAVLWLHINLAWQLLRNLTVRSSLIFWAMCGGMVSIWIHSQVSYPLQTPVGSLFSWTMCGMAFGLLEKFDARRAKID